MSQPERLYTVNIQETIEEHIWKRYTKTKSLALRPFIRRNRYYLDIRWGFVDFQHDTTRFDIRPDIASRLPAEVSSSSEPSASSKLENVTGRDAEGNKNVILYFSEYENKTPLDQQYTFNSSRETTASTSVSFEESYTKGAETSIEIKVPGDFVTIGAGLSGELSVTETKGQEFSETMSWDVNTQINVAKGHKAQATVYISEKNSMADFEVTTTMSLPDGKDLPVAVRRISDDKIMWVGIINDFEPVFAKIAKKARNIVTLQERPDEKRRMQRYCVVLKTHGTCKSVSWKNQQVKVSSQKIKDFQHDDNGNEKEDNQ